MPGPEIGLVVGEPATFRFFSSPVRKHDRPGDVVDAIKSGEVDETDSLEANLPLPEKAAAKSKGAKSSAAAPSPETVEDGYVPVRFHSRITELGVFELWCASTLNDQRWKLEFSVREDAEK